MSAPIPPIVSLAVEGPVDAAVVARLINHAGGQPGVVYGEKGKPELRKKIRGYNRAAHHAPWIVLVDLDDANCAPPILDEWVPAPAPNLCFRIAVREVEAWLMADAQTLAEYLGVKPGKIPEAPERLKHPKDTMVNLARRSKRRDICKAMVPREGSGRRVGPTYTSKLIKYIQKHWQPEVAARHAESLQRAINCLQKLIKTADKETGQS